MVIELSILSIFVLAFKANGNVYSFHIYIESVITWHQMSYQGFQNVQKETLILYVLEYSDVKSHIIVNMVFIWTKCITMDHIFFSNIPAYYQRIS